MKILIALFGLILIAGSMSFAQEARMTLTGDIIDNMCSSGKTAEELSAFVPTHTKECALQPQCVASGYNLYTDGNLLRLDAASNAKVAEFLKGADSKLQVEVVAKRTGDTLSIESIKNM